MNKKRPVLAITPNETLIFPSVRDAATNYGCKPSYIVQLIERNQIWHGRVSFDYQYTMEDAFDDELEGFEEA